MKLSERLRRIHSKMRGVSDAEVQAALSETRPLDLHDQLWAGVTTASYDTFTVLDKTP